MEVDAPVGHERFCTPTEVRRISKGKILNQIYEHDYLSFFKEIKHIHF